MYNVTITAGMTSSSFDVDIIDNMIQDGDKMFTITIRLISTCLPVTIDSDTTTVTIIDDEGTYSGSIYCVATYVLADMYIVLRIQFASTIFSGSESSGEVLVTIVMTGGIPNKKVSADINFLRLTATG